MMNPREEFTGIFPKYRFLVHVVFCICLLPQDNQACFGGSETNLTALASWQNITSPSYPAGYSKNLSCAWRITSPPGHIVNLDVMAKVDCDMNDRLEIYDSETEKPGSPLKKICAVVSKTNYHFSAYSTGQVLYILFSSNSTHDATVSRTFLIKYSSLMPGSVCSSSNTLDQNQNIFLKGPNGGVFTTPNFPNTFPAATNCKWKIIAPPGHIVKLYVDTININTINCRGNTMFRITDGFGLFASILRSIWCQYTWERHLKRSFYVLSSKNQLQVSLFQKFMFSNYTITGYGFKANYTFEPLDTSCGSCGEGRTGTINLRGQGATFHSPGFTPNKEHPKNMTCLWNITADPGFILEINTIWYGLIRGCESEFVKVYDGATLDRPVLGKLCKWQTVRYVYSTGNRIIVEMRTSSSEQRGYGFQMSYRAVKYERTAYMCTESKSELRVDEPTGRIVSPWYPMAYPNNAYCKWTYQAPFGRLANLTITRLHLQDSNGCVADSFEVFHAKRQYSEYRCGKVKTPISFISNSSSPNSKLEVQFKSDWSGRYPGFQAVFDSIEDPSYGGCTVQGQDNYIPLNVSSGVVFSPGYPKGIPANMKCTWMITVDEGNYVRLVFDVYDFNFNRDCVESIIEIREDPSVRSKSPTTLCGYQPISDLPTVFSSGRQLWIRYTHNASYDNLYQRGFSASFSSVKTLPLSISCRSSALKEIRASSGEIASKDYPLNYSNNAVCKWQIVAPPNKRVKLTFGLLDIQATQGCIGDFVEVYDGVQALGDSLGKFCGQEEPKSLYSKGRFMAIIFHSDESGTSQGFKASFETVYDKQTMTLIITFSVLGALGLVGIPLCVVINKRYRRSHGRSQEEIVGLHPNSVDG